MSDPGNPNWKYATTLALAAVLILVLGWLIRPRDEAPAPATLLSETELERLSRMSQRRSLENMTAYFSSVADDVGASVLHVRSTDTTALVWNDSTLVTAHAGHHPAIAVVVASAASDYTSETTAWGPNLPLAAVRRPDPALELAPVRRRLAPVQPSEWLVAVWRTGRGRAFAMGNALQTSDVTCGTVATEEMLSSLALIEPMAGGGLFDAGGELVGVILPCDDRLAAITPSGVDAMLALADSPDERLVAGFGLVAGPMDPTEAEHFDTPGGMLVREVWIGSAAGLAGLQPGDVILALGDTPVGSIEDLAPLADANRSAASLAIQRHRATLTLDVPPGGLPSNGDTSSALDAGLVWDVPSRGFRVDDVVAGSVADAAGIKAGDRLMRIDEAAPVSVAQMERLLEGRLSEPVYVEIERDSRRLGVLLP